jgi:hypothetical protein
VQQMSTIKQQLLAWRRSQVLELTSKGHNQSDIARILQVDKSVICRDMTALNQQSKENIKKYVDEKLPSQYEKCLVGLTAILREAWTIALQQQTAVDKREKIQALSLAKECYSMKLDLLTNATVVDDAIRFVSQKSRPKSFSNSNEEGSNKPDYGEDQLEEEEETREIALTSNQVF